VRSGNYAQACHKQKSRSKLERLFAGAQNRIRTCTPLRALPPQSSVSTNFTTWAEYVDAFASFERWRVLKKFGKDIRFFATANKGRKKIKLKRPGADCRASHSSAVPIDIGAGLLPGAALFMLKI
jgi:hypothetical protein